MKYLIAIVLVITIISLSHSQAWEKQSPIPTGENISSIFFLDSLNGYIAAGTDLFKTTDKGFSWEKVILNSNYFFIKSIVFTDSTTGYIAGSKEYIYKTSDAGNTFEIKFTGVSNINCLFFPSPDTGFAANNSGNIIRTTDAGNTWESVYQNSSSSFNFVCFPTSQCGYAGGGYNSLIKTTDGGLTWTSVYNNLPNYTSIQSAFFLSENYGYLLGSGKVYKTTNGGNSWNTTNMSQIYGIQSMYFMSTLVGYIAGTNGQIYKTLSGGNSWTQQETVTNRGLTNLFFTSQNCGFATGDYGIIIRTTLTGDSWEVISRGTYSTINQFFPVSPDIIYAASFDAILKTTDGGSVWKEIYQNINSPRRLFFVNVDTGYGISPFNFFKTTDGGNQWDLISLSGTICQDIYFSNSQTGYICGYSGSLLKTTDAGNTWLPLSSGTTKTLNRIYFLNDTVGFAGGNDGILIKTTDAGISWVNVSPSEDITVNDIQFISHTVGYLASSPHLYKTTNGGSSWINISTSTYPQALSVIDENNFFFIGGSYYYYTHDGGQTFESFGLFDSFSQFSDIYFYTSDSGYICGSSGLIYKSTNGGCITPESAGSISGNDTLICQGQAWHYYTASEIENADYYTWNYTGNASIISQSYNSLVLKFDENSTSGYLTVAGQNQCGTGTPSFPLHITVLESPTPVISYLNEDTLISSATEGNQWYNFSTPIYGATNQKYVPVENGLYYVIVTNPNGCMSDQSNTIYTTGINCIDNNFSFFYSNPISRYLLINSDSPENYNISIFNETGVLVYNHESTFLQNMVIDMKDYSAGIYFLHIHNSKFIANKKIIKL
ncbi:MAG TPA: hypothetical protein DEH02_01640 [Bacteroidales bacterium]|nr:MAG: hypothetical protein A2X01_00970 [Bacteroidetes bacterium GWF2_35_48]HBX49752.1 hypothetical protein [Bacteroidales bacterium]